MIVMVTGGNGYIGSHCVTNLLENGYDVLSLDNFTTGHKEVSETFSTLNSKGKFLNCISGDLLDSILLNEIFDKYDIKAIFHFAGLSQIDESIKEPEKYYHNNVIGTINLLNSMIAHNVRYIIFSSTAAIYGEPSYLPIDEKHPKEPINPYGYTKLEIEKKMDEYDKKYGLKSVRLRYFNVAGADSHCRVGEWHDHETHLIPNIIKSIIEKKIFSIFGNDYPTRDGTCERDYINVEDLVDAHILSLKYLMNGGNTDSFNLGTGQGSTIMEIMNGCEKITGKKIKCVIEKRREGDVAKLICDGTKAKNVLGWIPKRSLNDSIRTAYLWEKKRQGI